MSPASRPRNNFDGLRLLGAMAVVVSHQWWLLGSPEPRVVGPFTPGAIAVLVFFAISGHLVAGSWRDDPHVLRFLARRFLRIWPALAFSVSVTAGLFIALHPNFYVQVAAWEFWDRNLHFEYFDWQFFERPEPRLNAPLWMLQYEVGCYAMFALLGLALPKAHWKIFAGVAALAFGWWAYAMPLREPSMQPPPFAAILFAAVFLSGAALRFLTEHVGARILLLSWATAAAAALLGSPLLALVIALPATTIFVGQRSWPVLRQAARFGDFSYGIYLWGWPVQQAWISILGRDQAFATMLSLSVLTSAALAWVSWHAIEKQALKLKPRRPAVRTPASVEQLPGRESAP